MKTRKKITRIVFIVLWVSFQACEKQPDVPIVETIIASNIFGTNAVSGGIIITNKSYPVQQKGVCWSFDKNPTIVNDHTSEGFGTVDFTSFMDNLQPATEYYYRAYAISSEGIGYGNLLKFQTANENSSFIQLDSAKLVSLRSIDAYGEFNVYDANMPIKDYGFCWAYEKVPTVDDNIVKNLQGYPTQCGYFITEKGVPVLIRAFLRTKDGKTYYGLTTITVVPKEFKVEKIDRITFRSARVNIVHAEQPNIIGVYLRWWEQSETSKKRWTFLGSQGPTHTTYAFNLLPDRIYHVQPQAYYYDIYPTFLDYGDMATFSTQPLPEIGSGTLIDPYGVDGALYLEDIEGMAWVEGFINGVYVQSSGYFYEEPFTETTNILIAERSDEIWRGNSILVNLPAGPIRDALNLKENPLNKGKMVKIYGKCSLTSWGMDNQAGTMNDVTDFVIVDD